METWVIRKEKLQQRNYKASPPETVIALKEKRDTLEATVRKQKNYI